jgi:hypothetical protein
MAPSAEHLQGIADRVEITELLARYHQAMDRLDWSAIRRVFTEDAVCDYVGMSELFGIPGQPHGIDGIIAWLDAAVRPLERPQHFMSNIVFDIDGDQAGTRSYVWSPGGRGVYECEYLRTPDGWRIHYLRLEYVSSDKQIAAIQARHASATGG